MENMNNVNGNSIRKRRKNRRLLVRVGITVFVVFSLLIVLLGFLIVHTASSSFFSGQQDTLRAQLMKARSTISDYRVFEWVAEFWDNYTDEMAQPTDMLDLAKIMNSPMEEANTKEEAIRILEGYNEEEQMTLARLYTASLAYLVKEDISQSGDLFILMDIREGKEAVAQVDGPVHVQHEAADLRQTAHILLLFPLKIGFLYMASRGLCSLRKLRYFGMSRR